MRSFLMNLGVNLVVIYFAIAAYGSGANNHAQGVEWFVNQCIPSTTFVLVLYLIQQYNYKSHLNAIIAIEILSTITNLIACAQYAMAHKTAFIYANYENIMLSMFLAELAIIGFMVIHDGYSKRHHILRLFANDSRSPNPSNLYAREMPTCTIP